MSILTSNRGDVASEVVDLLTHATPSTKCGHTHHGKTSLKFLHDAGRVLLTASVDDADMTIIATMLMLQFFFNSDSEVVCKRHAENTCAQVWV